VTGDLQVGGSSSITSTGRILSAGGTVATPALSFRVEPDTGFYSGTNTIFVSTGGSLAATFSSNGSLTVQNGLTVNGNSITFDNGGVIVGSNLTADVRPASGSSYGLLIRPAGSTSSFANLEVIDSGTNDYLNIGVATSGADVQVFQNGTLRTTGVIDVNGTGISTIDGDLNIYASPAGGNDVKIDGRLWYNYDAGIGSMTNLCQNINNSTLGVASLNEIGVCSSSIRWKENVQTYGDALSLIRQVRPVTFDWKEDGRFGAGFIAEELYNIAPEFVYLNDGQIEGINYDEFTSAVLTKGLQELDLQVRNQSTRLTQAEQTLAVLNSTTTNLTKRNITVSNQFTTLRLKVTGLTELASLKVTGLTELANLKVNGKIITAGNTPTAVLGSTTTGQGSTYTIEGNDTAGTITYTSGTNTTLNPLAAGEQITVTFDEVFATIPRIALTAKDAGSAEVRTFVETTTEGFIINFLDAPAENTAYTFDYIVIQ
jgi:hypothetical protein